MNVLFICSANSARSILAEALLNGEGQGKFHAFSAGTKPSKSPHDETLTTLAARGYDVAGLTSNGIAPFLKADAPQMDLVVTVCNQAANRETPTLPGQPLHTHWGIANPLSDVNNMRPAMRETFETLKQRIQAFTWLPFERLDRQALQHRIDELGTPSKPPQT